MKNDSNPYYAMAGFYRTAVAVSALTIFASVAYAADPPAPRGNVSVNVNPTTGYYSTSNTTLRLPDGVRATPAAGATTVTKYAGGLQQSIPTGITIDAIKKSAPLPAVVRANTASLKSSAKVVLRGNLAGLVLGAGLNALLDEIGALIDESGRIKVPDSGPLGSVSPPADYRNERGSVGVYRPQCSPDSGWRAIACFPSGSRYYVVSCPSQYGGSNLSGAKAPPSDLDIAVCYYGGSSELSETMIPATPEFIDKSVDDSYVAEPSDWPTLTPHLELDDIEITSAPTLKGDPITTTVYDADGVPHEIKETNIWYDFDIRDNPSSSPSLDLKVREETKTYKDGVLTDTTTTETTQPAVVGGGGKVEIPSVEIPTDCDFHPTLCKWLDWTKEEPEEPVDNLSNLLKEVPISSKTFTISGGVAACPAPLVLNLSQFGSREVSYQPLCDLASTMKYLYLALMSFAAAVLLNRSINRV